MPATLEKTRTPGVYRRGGSYVIRYRANGQPRWETCRTYDEARRLRSTRERQAKLSRAHARGLHIDDPSKECPDCQRDRVDRERQQPTLHEYARSWIERYQGRGRFEIRDETRADYRRLLDQYALRFFPPELKLSQVTPGMVAEFEQWLRDPSKQNGRQLAAWTRRGILAPLRAMFATAVEQDGLASNPTREIRVRDLATVVEREDEDDVRVLSREQLDDFLRVVSPRWTTFFHLLAATGLRISEAIALQWRDVQLDGSNPCVHVRRRIRHGKEGPPKSRYGRRSIPIGHELVLALRELRRRTEWPGDTDPVFAAKSRPGDGTAAQATAYNPSNIWNRVLKPAAEEADVSWIGFHTFRHTCASLLFAEGRNVVQVQRWLGHHSPEFTLKCYVHLLPGDEVGDPLDVRAAHAVHTQATTPDDTTQRDAEREPLESLEIPTLRHSATLA